MTPKEKAIELIDKFGNIEIMFESQIGNIKYDEQLRASKQCALIAVEEILKSGPTKIVWEDNNTEITIMDEEWWESVKQEIEKL